LFRGQIEIIKGLFFILTEKLFKIIFKAALKSWLKIYLLKTQRSQIYIQYTPPRPRPQKMI